MTREIHLHIEDISRRLRTLSLEELRDVSDRIAEIECNGVQHALHAAAKLIVEQPSWDDEKTREWQPSSGTFRGDAA